MEIVSTSIKGLFGLLSGRIGTCQFSHFSMSSLELWGIIFFVLGVLYVSSNNGKRKASIFFLARASLKHG